jgi:hypothetical protein
VRALPESEVAKHRRSLFKNILNTLNHPFVADCMALFGLFLSTSLPREAPTARLRLLPFQRDCFSWLHVSFQAKRAMSPMSLRATSGTTRVCGQLPAIAAMTFWQVI